jgi:hypothetical protein
MGLLPGLIQRAKVGQRQTAACSPLTSNMLRAAWVHQIVATPHFSKWNSWSSRYAHRLAHSINPRMVVLDLPAMGSRRTITYNRAPPPSSRLRPQSQNLARSSINSRIWLQSSVRRFRGSTLTHSTSPPTSAARNASCSSTTRAFRVIGGSCSRSSAFSSFSCVLLSPRAFRRVPC